MAELELIGAAAEQLRLGLPHCACREGRALHVDRGDAAHAGGRRDPSARQNPGMRHGDVTLCASRARSASTSTACSTARRSCRPTRRRRGSSNGSRS